MLVSHTVTINIHINSMKLTYMHTQRLQALRQGAAHRHEDTKLEVAADSSSKLAKKVFVLLLFLLLFVLLL